MITIGEGKTGIHPVLFNLHEVLTEQSVSLDLSIPGGFPKHDSSNSQ